MRPPLNSYVSSRPLDASSLFNGAWPSSGTVITGSNGAYITTFKSDVVANWKSDPNKAGWLYPNDPPSRAFRSRGGIDSAKIISVYKNTFFYSPFFGQPTDMWYAIASRYRSVVEDYGLEPNWSGEDYVPCSEVKFCVMWRSDGAYDQDGNFVGETKRTASILSCTITNANAFTFQDIQYEIKAAGWEPEDEGFTQLTDPNNDYMPSERSGLWSKELGEDITDQSIEYINGGTYAIDVGFGARDDEIDKTISMDLSDLEYQAYNPQLSGKSPFFLTKLNAEFKVYFMLNGACSEDKCGFVGATYNVTMKYDKGTCSPKEMPERTGDQSGCTFSSSGEGSENFTYTVSDGTGINTYIEMGSLSFTPNQNEARKLKDFLLTSVTKPS